MYLYKIYILFYILIFCFVLLYIKIGKYSQTHMSITRSLPIISYFKLFNLFVIIMNT